MKKFLVGLTTLNVIAAPLLADQAVQQPKQNTAAAQHDQGEGAQSKPAEPETFTSEQHGYSITFPAGWKMEKDFRNLDVIALAPPNKDQPTSHANISVMAITSDTEVTLDALTDSTVENLKKIFKEIEIVSNTDVTVNGLKGKKLIYDYSFGDVKLQVEQFFFLKKQTAYIITCTTLLNDKQMFASDFQKTIESFKLQQ